MAKRFISLLLAAFMLIPFSGCGAKEKVTMENTQDSPAADSLVKSVSVDGVQMDYIQFGTGEKSFVIIPGLSVHSVMGSAAAVADAYSMFADEYTIYLFDVPKDLQDGVTVRSIAEDTAKAMSTIGISSADILGVSFGGMVSQYIAIDHPELVNKLILASTLSKPNAAAIATMQRWRTMADEKNEQGLIESFLNDVYSTATLNAYRDVLIAANQGVSDAEFERLVTLIDACLNFSCYDELSKIQCPVLVIGSMGDRVLAPVGSEEIAEAIGCEIYMYDENYGHGVYDEAPDYKQRCLNFLGEAE